MHSIAMDLVTRLALALAAALAGACDEPDSPEDLDEMREPPPGSVLHGMFAGRVPCADAPDGCERVKVAMTLHVDESTSEPTAYVLEWIFVGVDDVRHVAEGTWTRRTGTPWHDAAVVWELSDGGTQGYDRFLVLQDSVALFLDPALDLRVGDAGHAYALSRLP
jgi:hypothetical protein